MTEIMLLFVVVVNGISHTCCLTLEKLKLTDEDFWIRKNSFQISIKMHQIKDIMREV
jgi:hypothetical protein